MLNEFLVPFPEGVTCVLECKFAGQWDVFSWRQWETEPEERITFRCLMLKVHPTAEGGGEKEVRTGRMQHVILLSCLSLHNKICRYVYSREIIVLTQPGIHLLSCLWPSVSHC